MNLDLPLDDVSTEGREFLKRVQGNVLASHGREYSKLLMAEFHTGTTERREQLAERIAVLAAADVTTAADESRARSKNGQKKSRGPFAMVAFTFSGYDKLGIAAHAPISGYFRSGITGSNEWLPERDTSGWDSVYKNKAIDALFLVAGDSPKDVSDLEAKVKRHLGASGGKVRGESAAKSPLVSIVATELGHRLYKDKDKERPEEHFGFLDGISQPCFFRRGSAPGANGARHSPETPLKVVLTEDPGAIGEYGSYLAFLKMKQDVAGFEKNARDLAKELSFTGPKGVEYAKALIVGRSRLGTPAVRLAENCPPAWDERPDALDKLNDPTKSFHELNDFDFKADPQGQFCPFQAHVRKMNPRENRFGTPFHRDPGKDFTDDVYARIARRGIPYGERNSSDVGMLFMSFQSNLAQFLFHEWAADFPHSVRAQSGVDALTGHVPAGAKESKHKWPSPDGPEKPIEHALSRFITTKGGAFFFAPSIATLRGLLQLVKRASR